MEIANEIGPCPPSRMTEGCCRTLMSAVARRLRRRCEIVQNDRGGITARLVFPATDGQSQRPPTRRAKGKQAAA